MLNQSDRTPPELTSRDNHPASGYGRFGKRVLGPAARKGVLALLDQFVVSGTAFLTTVIVGRTCGADELGIYALALTLVALITSVQDSLVSTPYTIYCHRVDGRERDAYAGSVLVHHGLLAVLAMAGLAVCSAAMFAGLGQRQWAVLGAVLSGVVPFVLMRDFVRRLGFAHLNVFSALLLDAAVAVLQIGGLLGLAISGALSANTAYLAMGASCATAAVVWLACARTGFVARRKRIFSDLRRNWLFGRWVLAALMALMLHWSVVPWLLAFALGTHATGVFAACMSIVLFSRPVIRGINNVLVPRTALAFAEGGEAEVWRVVRNTTLLMGVAMALFCGAIMLVGGRIVSLLYGSEYAGCQAIITVLAVAALARALGMAVYGGLRAIERPDANFRANLLGLAATLTLCPILMGSWGVLGAAYGFLAGDAAAAAVRWTVFLRRVKVPAETNNAREDLQHDCQPIDQTARGLG